MLKADDLIKCIVSDVLLQCLTTTIDAKAVLAVERYGDVVRNRLVSLLDIASVANGTVFQGYVVLRFQTLDLTCGHRELICKGNHFIQHLYVTVLPAR